MTKIYTFVTNSINFTAVVPSGLDLTGVTNLRVKFKKPSGTIVMKNLTDSDIVSGTANIGFPVSTGDLDEEGIYDYEVADTSSGKDKKSKLLQFSVVQEIQ